jgi:fructose/tagatose bisphosphate aldolase
LVLHGGSGISSEQLTQAIRLGINKINIGTDLLIVFSQALAKYFKSKEFIKNKNYDPRNYFPVAYYEVEKFIIEKLKLLDSYNRA